MDVSRAASGRFDPRSRNILSGSSATKLFAENTARRDSFVRDKKEIPRGDITSGKRLTVSPHVRDEFAETPRSPFG